MKNIFKLFQFLVSSTLAFGAQSQWSNLVEIDPTAWSKRISTENFSNDQNLGIEYFVDPENIRQIGSRNFHIWHNAGNEYEFYLRLAKDVQYFERIPFSFREPGQNPVVGGVSADRIYSNWLIGIMNSVGPSPQSQVPFFIDQVEETYKYDSWDAAYQFYVRSSGYLNQSPSMLREYLLKSRYGIEANFVHRYSQPANNILDMFVLKTRFIEGADLNESVGFVFDSDPFGFAYRIPWRSRVAAHLTNSRSNTSYYQWVRVGAGDVLYGDIHEFQPPRPVNIGIIGDSFTSGEAAPLMKDPNLRLYIDEPWITEYANYGDRRSHRSIASGWEKAVCQQNRQKFSLVSINHNNVSSSGAVARKYGEKKFIQYGCLWDDEEDNPESGLVIEDNRIGLQGNRLGGSIDTSARQLFVLDELLERSGSNTVDVLGFTFGGNDAFFGAIIETFLREDFQDGDLNSDLSDLGSGHGFINLNPEVDSLDDILRVGRENLEVLGTRLLRNYFGFNTHHVIRGNYCNPIGTIRNYSPEGAPRFAAEIVESEMNLIRNRILPMMNDDLVGYDAQRFGYTLADTRLPTGESSGLPYRHPYHILAGESERYFEPMLVIADDSCWLSSSPEFFPFAFHPNVKGHDKIYRPIYNEKLADSLKASTREGVYLVEYEGPDVAFVSESLQYRDGKLELNLRARNRGKSTSAPCFVELSVQFGIGENDISSPIGTRARPEFSVPLFDFSGQPIGFPSLEPSLQASSQVVILEEGELEHAYYNFLIKHFLSLADQDFIREQIGFISPTRLAARFAAFIPLFREQINFRFRLVPQDGVPELNMINNEGIFTHDLPFEITLESFFAWIGNTRKEYFEELWNNMVGYGIKPESLANADSSQLYDNPTLLKDLFDATRIEFLTYDRDKLTSGETLDQSIFATTANLVEDALKVGMISKNPLLFDPNLTRDYLLIETSFGQKAVPFDQWAEIPDILPQDGGIYDGSYCKYEPSESKDEVIKYTDIPIRIATLHKYDALKDFHSMGVVTKGMLQLDLDFADRPASLTPVSRVTLRDLESEAVFLDYLHRPETQAQELDLNSYLFHSNRLLVDIDGHAMREVNRYYLKVENHSFVSQEAIRRDGSYVEFLLTIHGPFSELLSSDVMVSLSSPSVLDDPTNISNFILDTKFESQQILGEKTKTFRVRMPVELVYGQSKLIQIIDRYDPSISKFSSINSYSLKPLVPEDFDAPIFQVDLRLSSDNQVLLNFPTRVGQLYSIERSVDLVNWFTIESDIAGSGDVIQREYPAKEQTMYYRARIR